MVGGIAATLLGSATDTFDLDICPAADPTNLEALGRALVDLDTHLRGVDDPVPFVPDRDSLGRIQLLTLDTSLGPLDILIRPDGSPPYERLRRRSERKDLGSFSVLVASIDDLIAMKRSAGRTKDLVAIEELEAIRRLRRRLRVKE